MNASSTAREIKRLAMKKFDDDLPQGLICPVCGGSHSTQVLDTRNRNGLIRRLRGCRCGARITTLETVHSYRRKKLKAGKSNAG